MEGRSMRSSLVRLALVVLCLTSLGAPAAAVTDSNDAFVMQKLQQAWGSVLTSWTGQDPCGERWEGVICNINNRVIYLSLVNRGLEGTIPLEIGSLSALENLELSFNGKLRGELPSDLGSLTSLVYLSLQKCSFSGRIPGSLGKLTKLTFLALNNNRLEGPIPSALGALTMLKWFDVAYNRLSGPLPVSTNSPDLLGLDTWPDIEHYHLNNNEFTGFIPPELGKATKCLHLLLEQNQFTGSIPENFGNLQNLQILSLHRNQLSGPIPSTLNQIVKNGTYSGLHQIHVANNNLTGTVPVLDALNQLALVDFSSNNFDPQPFPSWLNGSSNTIQTIRFESGGLIGPLPVDILSYPLLQGLYLQNNQINETLTIPANLGRKLRVVSLQKNNIINIDQKDLNTKLPQIMLQGNPTCTGAGLTQARPTVCNETDTSAPTQWSAPLTTSATSGCQFCDNALLVLNPLSSSCHCSRPLIVALEIRAPTFTRIDDTVLWEALRNQTYVSLKLLTFVNNLPFESEQIWIKEAFTNEVQKVEVRLYFFPLVGEFMDKRTEDLIAVSFTQQHVKYETPFKPEIVKNIIFSREMLPVVSGGLSKGTIAGIAVGAAALLALIVFLGYLAVKLKRKAEKERRKNNPFAAWEKTEGGEAPKLKGARWFTFDDIKRMTNNFNEDNVLGGGGYGKVYKGIQAGTGAIVAVKRAQEGSKQGANEFKNEIELLSRVHHNNLVGLVGFCYEKAEQMLVYEYMPNGTLTDWLRGSKSDQLLDWEKRLLIALGAARGLAYLHDDADPPIIHRDVKACNILLDNKLNAKVADFGLSQLVPDEKDGSLRPTIKGTMGYLDPEYYMTSVMSTKSDVYSFGVVLLELLTGKPPINHGGHIVRDVRNKLERAGMAGVKQVLDPAIAGTPEVELEALVEIALGCVEDTSLERPSMHEVVKQLEALVGPKAHAAPGPSDRLAMAMQLMPRRDQRVPLQMSHLVSEDDDVLLGSASSQQSSFKYSGGFAPFPSVQPQ